MADKVVAHIDPEKCRQILFNLRSNAFKFTPVGGQIATKNSLENDRLHLAVTDTGPGIHPDGLPHVFDRFFQTTRPDKPAEGGTGIGLNLCQEYARLFGGTIDVESAPGEGSVFRVAFPVKPADMYSETPVSHPLYSETPVSLPVYGETGVSPYNNNEGGSKPTILVVEDNPDQTLRRGRTAGAHRKPAEKPESPPAARKPHVRFHRTSGLESGLRRCPLLLRSFKKRFGKLPSDYLGG